MSKDEIKTDNDERYKELEAIYEKILDDVLERVEKNASNTITDDEA